MGNVRRKHGWFKRVHETMRRQLKQLFLCPFWTPSCPELMSSLGKPSKAVPKETLIPETLTFGTILSIAQIRLSADAAFAPRGIPRGKGGKAGGSMGGRRRKRIRAERRKKCIFQLKRNTPFNNV